MTDHANGCDVADLPQASTCDHPADHFSEGYCPHCGTVVDASCPKCRSHIEISREEMSRASQEAKRMEFYRRFVNLLNASRNTRFTLQCYLISTGDAYADGVSMAELAAQWGVCRATVSKHCVEICAILGIQPSAYMRKEEMADKYRRANRRPIKLPNSQ